ncbi:MAG: YafY family transcriptional regulator [Defluviitaleaceae bacterium]|nr:YafY family transcriptional regulator [Defluviitaleaceae bacterium]
MHKRRVSAKELAEQFGVSTRTIYRDIDTLSLAGIPIYTEQGRNGGISLLPDFVLNKSILNEQEQNEILAALYGLQAVKPDEAGQALSKLSALFNKTAVNWLEVDFSDWSFSDSSFEDFKGAILQKRIAEFDYFNRYGEKTFRRVEPIQLWFKSRSWYIKGYCLTKQDMRLYKLSRVKNLNISDEHFTERSFLDIIDDTNHGNYQEQYITMKLRIAPEMAYRAYDEFSEDMIEKQPDGNLIATVTWTEDNWVYGFILSLGECIEVLEPPHVREIIKTKAQNIFRKYM